MARVVLITGGSSGIGEATALMFGRKGYNVAISSRSQHRLTHMHNNPVFTDGQLLCVESDIRDESSVKHLIDTTFKTYSRIDVLVNNAGVLCKEGLELCDMGNYDTVMATNLRGAVMATKFAVPHLCKTKGCIINVSSISGLRPMANSLAYCLSKAAMDQLTKCTALELGSKGVRVNSVNPGVVPTPIFRKAGMTGAEYQEHLSIQPSRHPLGRHATLDDVTNAIWFLASDSAAFITGHLMAVDGGRTLPMPSKL